MNLKIEINDNDIKIKNDEMIKFLESKRDEIKIYIENEENEEERKILYRILNFISKLIYEVNFKKIGE